MARQAYFKEKPQDTHANNLALLKDKIKNADLGGCYIFYGDEEYTKNHYCKQLTDAAGSDLNVTSFYSTEFNLPDFLSACETSAVESFDMFSMDSEEEDENGDNFRVIKLFSPDLSSLSKKDMDYFLDFLGDLPEKTIVIFWFYDGEEDAVFKDVYKKIGEISLIVNFRREPASSSILITWILRHFSRAKLNVDRHVAVHLCQVVGNSMMDLKNEIDKLIDYLYYEKRDTLTTADVNFICIKSKAAQIFDISSGALSGDFIKAAKALDVLKDKREAPLLIFGTIAKAIYDLSVTDICLYRGMDTLSISKKLGVPEFVVKNNSSILRNRSRDFNGKTSFLGVVSRLCNEYDKKIKSSRTDGYELLLELIFKISVAGRSVS